MYSGAIRSLVICTFGAAVIAGCASSPSSPPIASAQSNVQRGQVAAVETTAVINQSTAATSSGSSTVITASGGPDVITANFTDGTQGRYLITEQAAPLKVGQPVTFVKAGDGFTIFSP